MQKTNEIKEFPLEHFLPIDNEPFFLCRVSIFPVKQKFISELDICLLYTSPSPRDRTRSRMPSSA